MKHILLLKSKTLPKKYPTSNLEESTKMLLSLTYQLIKCQTLMIGPIWCHFHLRAQQKQQPVILIGIFAHLYQMRDVSGGLVRTGCQIANNIQTVSEHKTFPRTLSASAKCDIVQISRHPLAASHRLFVTIIHGRLKNCSYFDVIDTMEDYSN